MHIEVLICTHNRSWLIRKLLDSLNQVIEPDNCKISIFIVSNACTDETESILKEYKLHQIKKNLLPLTWYSVPEAGKSNALNFAIPLLEGDLIAMVDDDHRISEGYFEALSKGYFNYSGVDVFFGKILPDWSGDEPDWAHEKGQYAIYPLPVPQYDKGDESFEYRFGVSTPGGGNLALKNHVFKKVGLFKTNLGPSGHNLGGGEDSDFVKRAISMGMRLRYLPDMIQYHFVDPERFRMSYIITKSFQRSRAVVLIDNNNDKKTPLFLWKKLLIYVSSAIFSLSLKKTRFYLVRIAATLGEISAYLSSK